MKHLLAILLFSLTAAAQSFPGADQWRGAILASDIASLRALYSTNPPARYLDAQKNASPDITPEIDFWQKLLKDSPGVLQANVVNQGEQKGLYILNVVVSLRMKTDKGERTRFVLEQQAWQKQGEAWRIVMANHSDVLKMRPAMQPNPKLYNKDADARAEIQAALARATKDHQRVILVFGGNWCYDCHVLDQAFHQPDVAPLVDNNFIVIHVDIGDDGKKNNDLAAEYHVPLDKGVPALAILDANGKLLYSQQNGEWESARSLDPDDVIAFLTKWKP